MRISTRLAHKQQTRVDQKEGRTDTREHALSLTKHVRQVRVRNSREKPVGCSLVSSDNRATKGRTGISYKWGYSIGRKLPIQKSPVLLQRIYALRLRSGARIKKEGVMPRIIFRSHPVLPDVAPVGQCAGSTRLYSARSQTWSCAFVLREKAHSSA